MKSGVTGVQELQNGWLEPARIAAMIPNRKDPANFPVAINHAFTVHLNEQCFSELL